MKLKALKPRLYNIMFHTHTVSGIVISFALFIIFYAGAFSLFRHDLYRWENPKARFEKVEKIDFDKVINTVKGYDQNNTNFHRITIKPPTNENPFIKFYGSTKTPEGKNKNLSYYINPHTGESFLNANRFADPNSLTYLGETIYRLHYFRQIPIIGIYLAGLVGFFFLFATITGVLIHWKNIVNKFYDFRVKGKWKQIWTNSHTVFGFITLPFQLSYAITGALLGLSILLLAPSAFLLYGGDTNEIIKLVQPSSAIKYDDKVKTIPDGEISINDFYIKAIKKYPNHDVKRITLSNYGKVDGTVLIAIDNEKQIMGDGELIYQYKDGKLINEIIPNNKSYTKGVYRLLIKLHYANFGGFFLKIIYFILSMLTCYVIISGVLIWQKARDNKRYTSKQKRFHHRITKFYLAITLSMFPAVALIFIANKIIPIEMHHRVVYVKSIFFYGWLLLTIIGLFWNDYRRLNKNYLIIGSILGLLIPIANGAVTGDWMWKTWGNGQFYVFSVDVTWLLTGFFGVWIYTSLRKKAVLVNND